LKSGVEGRNKRIKPEERKAEADEERLARKTGSKAPKEVNFQQHQHVVTHSGSIGGIEVLPPSR
jgi:hypothetical protein